MAAAVASRTRDDTVPARTFRTPPDKTRLDGVLRFDPILARGDELLDAVDVGAPRNETPEDRALRRVTELCARCAAWLAAGDFDQAVVGAELALEEPAVDERVQRALTREQPTLSAAFESYLGDLGRPIRLARPLDELADLKLDPSAAFLLSRIDSKATVEELLEMSEMPRFEASRQLCRLVLRKIIVVG